MFKRMVYALLGLLAVFVLVMVASRLWPASAQQKQARAALEQPLDWPGANAWALLETLDHDGLDMAQRQALVDDRAVRFAAWAQATAAQRYGSEPDLLQGMASSLPPLGAAPAQAWERSELLCAGNQADNCLAKVRQAPAAVASELQKRAGRLQRIAQLADYGHVRSPYVADVQMPYLHTLAGLFDPLAAHALAHVQGNSAQAMEGLCRDMGTGRMLLTQSDSLINAMVGNAMLQANGLLLGQVLAELPVGQALPEYCSAALAPLQAQEMGLCRAMRTEYGTSHVAIARANQYGTSKTPGGSWVLNVDKTLNRSAAYLGQGCLAPMQQTLAGDLPADLDISVGSLWRMECPANAIGCLLTSIAAPAYTGYQRRAQDTAAQQRLLGALVWLRAQPAGEPLAQRLQHLPPELVSVQRSISLSADGRALQIAQRYGRKGPEADTPLRVALPQAWWPQPPADGPALP